MSSRKQEGNRVSVYQSSPSGIKQEPNHNVDSTQPVHLTRRAKHEQRFQRLNLSSSPLYINASVVFYPKL